MKEYIVPEHIAKTACLGKIWFLRYGAKRGCPTPRRLRFFFKKKFFLNFFFQFFGNFFFYIFWNFFFFDIFWEIFFGKTSKPIRSIPTNALRRKLVSENWFNFESKACKEKVRT